MNAAKLSPTVNGAAKATMASHLRLLQMARSRSSPAPFRGLAKVFGSSIGVSPPAPARRGAGAPRSCHLAGRGPACSHGLVVRHRDRQHAFLADPVSLG